MWPNPPKAEDLVTFTEEFLNEKPHFLCSVINKKYKINWLVVLFIYLGDNHYMI